MTLRRGKSQEAQGWEGKWVVAQLLTLLNAAIFQTIMSGCQKRQDLENFKHMILGQISGEKLNALLEGESKKKKKGDSKKIDLFHSLFLALKKKKRSNFENLSAKT